MSVLDRILWARRMKQQLDEVERAKLNAQRAALGLPPIKTWGERLSECICGGLRSLCLRTPCASCLYSPVKKKWCTCLHCGPFKDGTYSNYISKTLLGFSGGIVLSFLYFLLLHYQLLYGARTSMITCSLLGLFLSIGLAFSNSVRCLVLLTLPTLCSSKGRSVLLGMAFVLVMTHPVKNFSHNLEVLGETVSCGQEMADSVTKQLVDAALAPAIEVIDQIKEVLELMMQFAAKLRNAFVKIQALFREVLNAVRRVFSWLAKVTTDCNANVGEPYNKCRSALEEGYRKCKDKLPPVIDKLCHLTKVVSWACNIVKIGEVLCKIPGIIKNVIVDELLGEFNIQLTELRNLFDFDVKLDYHFNVTLQQSRSFAEIRDDMMADLKERLSILDICTDWSHLSLAFMFGYLAYKALKYRHKYLTRDTFDNCYVTLRMRVMDDKREEQKKETILPLNWKEASKYILTNSIMLANSERKRLLKGLFVFVGTLLHASFYLSCDAGLYWLLDMLRRHGQAKLSAKVPSHLKMHVQGEGVMSDIYRALVSRFDPIEQQEIMLDTQACLPHPTTPDFRIYRTIGILLFICFVLLFTDAYGLRLRHVIVGSYYPRREKARAAWLYNHILRQRGGFLKFMRRKLRRNKEEKDAVENVSLLAFLGAKSSLIAKLLRCCGYTHVYCLSCAQAGKPDDEVKFVKCQNVGCTAIYCRDCFTDINNMCTVCMSPVEYGDHSDFSEERDSSDEEVPTNKQKLLDVERQWRPQHQPARPLGGFRVTPSPQRTSNVPTNARQNTSHVDSSDEESTSDSSPTTTSTSVSDSTHVKSRVTGTSSSGEEETSSSETETTQLVH